MNLIDIVDAAIRNMAKIATEEEVRVMFSRVTDARIQAKLRVAAAGFEWLNDVVSINYTSGVSVVDTDGAMVSIDDSGQKTWSYDQAGELVEFYSGGGQCC